MTKQEMQDRIKYLESCFSKSRDGHPLIPGEKVFIRSQEDEKTVEYVPAIIEQDTEVLVVSKKYIGRWPSVFLYHKLSS